MSASFEIADEARADLFEIWNYIAEDSGDHADRVLARLHDAFEQLALNPAIGCRRISILDARHRFWPVQSWVIGYREGPPVTIIAVAHGARQLETFFRERLSGDEP